MDEPLENAALSDTGNNEITSKTKEQPLTEQPGPAPTEPDNWKGDKRYFQTGKKAGQLKPSAESAEPTKIGGLDFASLQPTASQAQPAQPVPVPDKKAEKEKKKLIEAKTGAKIIMRMLDTLVMYISAGTFGGNFTAEQKSARNNYRDELEEDWQDYLLTLDVSFPPILVAMAGSVFYVTPALETPKGIERTTSLKEKIFGKIAMKVFSKKTT